MKYFKKIEYQENGCIKSILTLEQANGYSATYKCVDSLGSITFSKNKYLECIKNKTIRGI